MSYYDFDSYEDEAPSLIAQARAEQRYWRQYNAHPDPRDPDFPGYPGDDEDEE